MREALFIKKNKDRWLKIQQEPSQDPDEMAADFTQLVNDLAYAKTFYPSGKVTGFINSQASKIYLDIYKNRKEESNRLVTFWKYDLPLTIRKHYKVMLFSLALFLLFASIGFFLAKKDESLLVSMMPAGYDIETTKENIREGNPFEVYEHGNVFLSWLHLMIHNIRVSFIMFVSGIFCGIPSMFMAAKNAVMLGGFDQLFASRGFGVDFWLVVFVHGTLEITALILASGAGLILGKSFLFPGTIKRMDAFKQGAKDGVKIMIGLMPVFALAAFFEGFITRLYNNISWFTTFIFGLSVVFVAWYFIIYPIRLGKKFKAQLNEEEV
ncbi:MAG: stage II sporulation protein M [Chitinophagaceae bacterium]|nr:stage II sporulation protein M [Chitinophagaceae bacterium]